MKKTERTRLETLLKRRTSDSLSPDETRILIRLSAKRAAELHHQADSTPTSASHKSSQLHAS